MATSPPSTLYIHGTVITVNKTRDVLLDGAILVVENRITAIDKTSILVSSSQVTSTTHTVDLEGKIVIPGLINAHAHLVQSLMRGLAEDLDLYRWACDAIWPLEANYAENDGYTAAKLTMAEMLKSGTTCFLEPMLPSHAGFGKVVRAVEETGIRACLGKLIKAPKANTKAGGSFSDARDKDAGSMTIEAVLEEHKNHHGSLNDRLHVWMAPETPRGADESFFTSVGEACEKHELKLTVHVSEAPRDFELIRECYKATPVEFCHNNKMIGSGTVLAHMCHLNLDVDADILKRTGTSVAHNPSSNCKLADGIAPIPELLARGVNVALGTDGAPCSNTYDMIREMHLAGIIHKGRTNTVSTMTAEQVLEMATINGAKALGLEKDIGSLEVGKKADFVVVGASGLYASPYDLEQVGKGGAHPVTAVVHSCTGGDVEMVVVDGKVVVEGGRLTTVDEEELKQAARSAIAGIRQRSGVNAQAMKNGWRYV